ncbi:MAG: hypothetical protein M3004_07040 [Bacteroidota bacterium]|nr:hypothetical protein [Bacteroidota bacterium]
MKQNVNWIMMPVVLMIVFIFLPSLLHAQGGPGGDPDAVPVDGGLSILAAAGVAYSVKKIKDFKKKRKSEEIK